MTREEIELKLKLRLRQYGRLPGYILARVYSEITGAFRQETIRSYWWNPCIGNFGDLLTAPLLKHFGYHAIHAGVQRASLACVGSIVQSLPDDFRGIILGSGLIRPYKNKRLPKATFLAVRGALTRDALGLPEQTVLGDPGLLADLLLSEWPVKKHTLGIIPHYKDKRSAHLLRAGATWKGDSVIIDVFDEPISVIRKVAECDAIISSSLHGLIVADALGIPNARFELSDVGGGNFKFDDYASARGRSLASVNIRTDGDIDSILERVETPPVSLHEVKAKLRETFQQLRQFIS